MTLAEQLTDFVHGANPEAVLTQEDRVGCVGESAVGVQGERAVLRPLHPLGADGIAVGIIGIGYFFMKAEIS